MEWYRFSEAVPCYKGMGKAKTILSPDLNGVTAALDALGIRWKLQGFDEAPSTLAFKFNVKHRQAVMARVDDLKQKAGWTDDDFRPEITSHS
jgi:hypothetical protein